MNTCLIDRPLPLYLTPFHWNRGLFGVAVVSSSDRILKPMNRGKNIPNKEFNFCSLQILLGSVPENRPVSRDLQHAPKSLLLLSAQSTLQPSAQRRTQYSSRRAEISGLTSSVPIESAAMAFGPLGDIIYKVAGTWSSCRIPSSRIYLTCLTNTGSMSAPKGDLLRAVAGGVRCHVNRMRLFSSCSR